MKYLLSIFLLCFMNVVDAQTVNITYKPSNEDFRNPERGFYKPYGTKSSDFDFLDTQRLGLYRTVLTSVDGAQYSAGITLIYRGYELNTFKHQPLSQEFLSNLQEDFDATRYAGLKMILRFAYTNSTHGGDCKDEYKICPPYGDAPRAIVLQHIQQLKPLLQKNADIIAVLQQGFIGIWGENYFTDYFGCATDDGEGRINDSSWLHRNEVLKALLDAMPPDRMVQVRTPQIKQRYLYGPRALLASEPLTPGGAFNKTDMARIGFHNDCFLASPDDYGTFYDYGNSVSKRDTANWQLRKYFRADSRYVAVGGETCDDAYSPQNDCEPAGHAETEMADMHYSYLNMNYNLQVNNDWDSLGCIGSIKRRLGYRIALKTSELPKRTNRGTAFNISIKLENTGYASPFNPRPVQLILRHKKSRRIIALDFEAIVQKWYPGNIDLNQEFVLPADAPAGKYELLLNLPDGYKTLQDNPVYSIRLANEGTWEPVTGYNRLKHVLVVR